MKKLFLLFLTLTGLVSAKADLTTSGYYRIRNVYTQRFVTVADDECEYVDFVAGKIDGHSMVTEKDFSLICHDPASIIYIDKISGSKYEVAAQGVKMSNMMKYDFHLLENGKYDGQKTYRLYGVEKGVTKYLADKGPVSRQTMTVTFGNPMGGANTNSQLICNWMILPVEASSADNYFGVLPTVEADGAEWASLYASFPYSAFSEDMEFYYPCAIAYTGICEMKKIEGVVPGGVPVIVKCKSVDPAANRLNIGGTAGKAPADNKMRGQYFNCYMNNGEFVNRLAYNPDTMRVLGRCSDGSVGFVTDESLDFIPANSTYIVVEPWYPKEIKFVFSHEEYDAGVGEIKADPVSARPDVYNFAGVRILSNATKEEIKALPPGIYIIGGEKIVIK